MDKLEKFQYIISTSSKKQFKHTILVVDDEKDNLQLLERTFKKEYNVISAQSGQQALEIVEKFGNDISLILSDQRMPDMTGVDFLAGTIEKYPYIIKMLLTGYTDIEAMIDGVNKCQLFQYITKPFDTEELLIIIKNGINAYELKLSKNTLLQDLKELFFTTIKSITNALDAKDTYTHGHSHRVTLYSLIISKELDMEENFIKEIEIAGLLHDIGKVGVPEEILCKPGRLTNEEYDIIKLHPGCGKKILNGIRKFSNISSWINSHHERWDGCGYPNGLKDEEIPLPARILAIADTYDAMTSNRPYRQGLPHQVALEEIINCAGSQFDPKLVKIFSNVEHIFRKAVENPGQYYNEYSILNKILEV
ncbi:MAG: HD domain-containing phosphohydrolase [bacterium]